VRPLLPILTIIGLAGCASQPVVAPTPPPATSNPLVANPAAEPLPAAAPAAAAPAAKSVAKVSAPAGYKAVNKHGQTFYCREYKATGSNFPTEVCLTPADFKP